MRRLLVHILYSPIVENGFTFLSGWHWLYIGIVVASAVGVSMFLCRATHKAKEKTRRFLAYIVPTLYIADFFIMPLSTEQRGILVMKLPFHICTLLAVCIPFAEFNRHLQKHKDVIVMLSCVCASAYILYPGSALASYKPYSYLVIQTMTYHGAMLMWSLACIVTDDVRFHPRQWHRTAPMIAFAQLWAAFGNHLYSYADIRFDWLLMSGQCFPMLPLWLVAVLIFAAIFGGCALVNGIVCLIKRKRTPPA